MKTIFALLGLFMFASVSSTDVTTTTTNKVDVKEYQLSHSGGTKTGEANNAGTKTSLVVI